MNLNFQTITETELLQAALVGLEKQRDYIAACITRVRALIAGETIPDGDPTPGERKPAKPRQVHRRRMSPSPSARRHMAEAQRLRWAKIHGARKSR